MISKINAFKHLLTTYMAALPKVVEGMFNIFNPVATQRFVHNILGADDLQKNCPRLGTASILEILKSSSFEDIEIMGKYYDGRTGGTHNMLEDAILAFVCKTTKPKLIFEFGTFIGQTTRIFALNTPPNTKIVTLDLADIQTQHVIGKSILGTPEQNKVLMISGNSTSYDFSQWHGKCDLVWVDACHDYDYVVSDTKNAFKLVRPGGCIMWHDYRHTAWWSGVTRHLRELKPSYPNLIHIRGTTIAILQNF
ncbi:MAG: class I SAM-dependent methyltransferase [Candidatus Scalindua sediminis]|nr:class I SAM-dependent methyltransferase [Candidatus Scalindua sediminis]